MNREAGRTLCGTVGILGMLWLAALLLDRWLSFAGERSFFLSLSLYGLCLLFFAFAADRREEVRRMRALDKKIEKMTAKAYETFSRKSLTDSELLRMEKVFQSRLVKAVDFGASYQGEIEEVYSKRNALRRLCAERGIGSAAWQSKARQTDKGEGQ